MVVVFAAAMLGVNLALKALIYPLPYAVQTALAWLMIGIVVGVLAVIRWPVFFSGRPFQPHPEPPEGHGSLPAQAPDTQTDCAPSAQRRP